jgi:hypothetical protein
MNTETYLPRRFSSQITVRSVALTALLAVAPLAAMAQSEVAASTHTLTSGSLPDTKADFHCMRG